ncbi:MAG: 2-oxo-4-hydroxy-4-carboxy-5-ureidoimidazoline decarboxylase [Leptolyngbyaceae cyanobacterium]
MYTLAEVNQFSQAEFVAVFGAVFEATPAIAADVWHDRPFVSVRALHQAMCEAVEKRDRAANLQLLQAHPDLGSRVKMAMASVQEQASVGLDALTEEEFARFQQLNQAYRERFGFPFIIAVRNQTKDSILQQFEVRSRNSTEQEYTTALSEVRQIAWYRLTSLVLEGA